MSSDLRADPAPGAAHERGKQKRRRAILDAASLIIQRSGEAGMTMRAMAAEAGVSPATPYNLFGSKQAILTAIYDEDLDAFRSYFESRASDKALVRIFDLVDVTIGYIQRQPDFYRALFAILQRNSGSELGSGAWSPRLAYLRDLVRNCVAAGELRDDTPIYLVSSALVRIFKAIGQEWVEGSLTLEAARTDLGISFNLVLASLVTAKGEPWLAQARGRYDQAGMRPRPAA